MCIVIRDVSSEKITDLETAKIALKKIISDVFNQADMIEQNVMGILKMTDYGFAAESHDIPHFWYENVGIKSDGAAFGFSFIETHGGSFDPDRNPDWFKPSAFRLTSVQPVKARTGYTTHLELTGTGFDSTVRLFAHEKWTSDFADGISIRNVVTESQERLSFDLEVSGETSPRGIDFQLVKPPSVKPGVAGVLRFSVELRPEFE